MATVMTAKMFLGGVVDERNIAELADRDMAAGKAEDASRKSPSVLQKNHLLIFFESKGNLAVEQLRN